MAGRVALKGLPVGVVLALAAASTSCSVDDRQLRAGGSAGSVSSAGTPGLGGEAGQSDGNPPVALPVCDYSAGVDPGCETLVSNPGFARDTAGWKAEDTTVAMSWKTDNATETAQSGSLSVLNSLYGAADGIASRAAAQCLSTSYGRTYDFALDMFIPEGQGEGLDGGSYQASAGLSVIFYSSKHCDEFTLASATSDLLEADGSWAHREGHAVAPQGAQSMLVRLVTFKNFQEFNFEAYFDNVLVKAE